MVENMIFIVSHVAILAFDISTGVTGLVFKKRGVADWPPRNQKRTLSGNLVRYETAWCSDQIHNAGYLYIVVVVE